MPQLQINVMIVHHNNVPRNAIISAANSTPYTTFPTQCTKGYQLKQLSHHPPPPRCPIPNSTCHLSPKFRVRAEVTESIPEPIDFDQINCRVIVLDNVSWKYRPLKLERRRHCGGDLGDMILVPRGL